MSTPITSVLSYPDRGPWGSSAWRGNCSGYIYRDLFEAFGPVRRFVDPMVGSGTSVAVARSMGIEAVGLDLAQGFNVVRDSILEAIGGEPADMVVSHPPYGCAVRYSGEVWGSEPHPDDLSRCASDDEFMDKLQAALLNQREATRRGGTYGLIIGDRREKGRYSSYGAQIIARMPASELKAVMIKLQHRVLSRHNDYRGEFTLPRIAHEYVIVFARSRMTLVATLNEMATQGRKQTRGAWRGIVRNALVQLGGKAALAELYEAVMPAARAERPTNTRIDAKVRQVLQEYPDFEPCARGVWRLAA